MGAGDVRSSLTDLLAWSDALYGGSFLPAAQKAEMLQMSQVFTEYDTGTLFATPRRYGLGAMGWCPCSPATSASVVGHSGNAVGGRTLMVYDLRTGVAVAMEANVGEVSSHQLDVLLRNVIGLTGMKVDA